MNPFEMRHRRRKGEDLRAWVLRAITTECESDIPGVKADMIDEALAYYRGRVAEYVEDTERSSAITERKHLEARLAETTRRHAELQAKYAALRDSMPRSVSAMEAEDARQRAAAWMREKAATMMEWPPGNPTQTSEEIRDIPSPKPKFCTQEELDARRAAR